MAYIKLEDVLKAVNDIMTDSTILHKFRSLRLRINKLPTADVEEVKHGEWQEEYYGSDNIVCSSCGHMWNILDNDTHTFNRCPNCGAKMDGGKASGR